MPYPDLDRKFRIVRKAFEVSAADVAHQLDQDKRRVKPRDRGTVDRHLSGADRIDEREKGELVQAVCKILKREHQLPITDKIFQQNDILSFCKSLKVDPVHAAVHLGLKIPIPEIFLQSVFYPHDLVQRYEGLYLIFRHDKEKDRLNEPYFQACASISNDEGGLLLYRDEWEGDNNRQSFSGLVFSVGKVTNIVGESKGSRISAPEIWWCGLVGDVDENGRAKVLRGYVSDVTRGGTPFTDRIIMVRVEKKEIERVRLERQFYVSYNHVQRVAGEEMAQYLAEWETIKIDGGSSEPKQSMVVAK